jgi:hypothetical protein
MPEPTRSGPPEFRGKRAPRLVGIEGWNAIDAHELRAGSDPA